MTHYDDHPEALEEAVHVGLVRSWLFQGTEYCQDVLAAATERDLDQPRDIILRRELERISARVDAKLRAAGVAL